MIPDQVRPITDAIAAGIPLGKHRAGDKCPRLPATPMILMIDDVSGLGPSRFDAATMFDQIDCVVIALPLAFETGAAAVAARARTGDRALLVQTPIAAVAQWLTLIAERRKLAHNFALFGEGDLPSDAALMLRDIGALASSPTN